MISFFISVVPLPKYGLMDIVFVYDVFGIGAQKTHKTALFSSSLSFRKLEQTEYCTQRYI